MTLSLKLNVIQAAIFFAAACSGKHDGTSGERSFALEEIHSPAGTVETLLELPWGSGGWAAGRVDGVEADSVGPMSFTISPAGEILLLDQVNRRVLVFAQDGSPLREVPIPSDTFEDILVAPGGEIILLDRLVRASVVVIDRSGGITSKADLAGPGVQRTGNVTAMFLHDDGLWVEYRHAEVVRLLDENLRPCEREIVHGRKLSGGARLLASLEIPRRARLLLPGVDSGTLEIALTFDHDLSRIIWAEGDAAGRLYVFFHFMDLDDENPALILYEKVAGVRLDGELRVEAAFTSPHVIGKWSQFKEFEVTKEGRILQMTLEEEGVKLLQWRLP